MSERILKELRCDAVGCESTQIVPADDFSRRCIFPIKVGAVASDMYQQLRQHDFISEGKHLCTQCSTKLMISLEAVARSFMGEKV